MEMEKVEMKQMSHGRLVQAHVDPNTRVNDSVWELAKPLLAALDSPRSNVYLDRQHVLRLLQSLRYRLNDVVNVSENRLAPRCTGQFFGFTHFCAVNHGLPIRGATYLDFGCGSINPFGRMMALIMAGAWRAGCVELDPLQDPAEAAMSLADMVAAAVLDPKQVFCDLPVRVPDLLANLADFDLKRLAAGDLGGIPKDRLRLFTQPLEECGIPDKMVDVVVSNSVLEHVTDADATLATMAQLVRPGGFAMHGIDTADHRWYGNPKIDRLEFLTEDPNAQMIAGCNRLRLVDFDRLFRKHGFDIVVRMPIAPVPVTPQLRRRLVKPWRDMPDDDLNVTWCNYLLRRR
jgi:SAM-dependent methyltransferase